MYDFSYGLGILGFRFCNGQGIEDVVLKGDYGGFNVLNLIRIFMAIAIEVLGYFAQTHPTHIHPPTCLTLQGFCEYASWNIALCCWTALLLWAK